MKKAVIISSIFVVLGSIWAIAQPIGRIRPGGGGRPTGVALEVLKSGSGFNTFQDICSIFSGELTGNYFCMNGSGTFSAGGITMTPQASPATETRAHCPNGPNCASTSGQRLNGTTQGFISADMASPTGDVSLVAIMEGVDFTTARQDIVTKDQDPSNRAINLFIDTNRFPRLEVCKTDSSCSTVVSDVTVSTLTRHIIVGTYDFVADGTSVGNIYVDGVNHGNLTTMVGPIQVASGTFWGIGENEVPRFFGGLVGGAMMTEKVLSPTVVTGMADISLGKFSGGFGEAITISRTSGKLCVDDSNGVASMLPINTPCILKSGILVEAQVDNVLLRSRDLSNSVWVKTAGTGAKTQIGITGEPNGASLFTATSANGNFVQQIQTGGGNYTCSFYAKRVSGSGTVQITADKGVAWTTVAAPSSSVFTRYSKTQSLTVLGPATNISTMSDCTGNLSDGNYCYKVTSRNSLGESTGSSEICSTVSSCFGSGLVHLSWNTTTGATSYGVFGRTSGNTLRLSNPASTSFDDDGLTTPSGAVPSRDSTADHACGMRLVTSGNSIIVDGAQLETGGFASGPIFTTTAVVTRSADDVTMTMPSTIAVGSGCVKACVEPQFGSGGNPSTTSYFLDLNNADTAIGLYESASGNIGSYNGTTGPSLSAAYSSGTSKCYITDWSSAGNSLITRNISSGTSGSTTFSGFPSIGATLHIGKRGAGGANRARAIISDIKLGNAPGWCK